MKSLRRTFPSRMDQLAAISQLVDLAAQACGFDERTNYACQLAVNEACENIVRHAYPENHEGEIEILLQSEPGKLVVELADSGRPFDPSEPPSKRTSLRAGPPSGGWGLGLIHEAMDEVSYRRTPHRNFLTMRKWLPKPAT